MNEGFVSLSTVLALMLFLCYVMHFGLSKLRMPHLLAPLLIGFLFQVFLPSSLKEAASGEAFAALSDLGVVFLLLVIGLQLSVKKLRMLSGKIVLLAFLNLAFSSILGFFVLASFGYPLHISILVSTALATVAETTVAPILEEGGIINTETASLIIGSGIIDDVAEVAIASVASVIVGAGRLTVDHAFLPIGFAAFVAFTLIFHKLVIPMIIRIDREPSDFRLFLLAVFMALTFTAISENFSLGILLGAITAGLLFQRIQNLTVNGARSLTLLRTVAYSFFGPIFFFGIGLSVNLLSFGAAAQLTILLLLANFAGKFSAVLLVGKIAKMNIKTVALMGLGLSAKFSMGIIPVQILYAARAIDQQLFSAFVAVSAITTMIIPVAISYLVNRWKPDIQ